MSQWFMLSDTEQTHWIDYEQRRIDRITGMEKALKAKDKNYLEVIIPLWMAKHGR